MTKRIAINGQTVEVLNTLSDGPGTPVTTYELRGRAYVYAVAGGWMLQEPGQFPRKVEVTTSTEVISARVLALVAAGQTPVDALKTVCGAANVDAMIDTLYVELRKAVA